MVSAGLMMRRIGVEANRVGRVGVASMGVLLHDGELQGAPREGVGGYSPNGQPPCGLLGGM